MAQSIRYTCAAAIVFVSHVIPTSAHAHDPSHQYTDWFQKQRNQSGYVCCDGSDAHYLGPDDWTSAKGNYRVRIKGIWFDVDDNQMLRPDGGPNPNRESDSLVSSQRIWLQHSMLHAAV
jgi:hypothetical protein